MRYEITDGDLRAIDQDATHVCRRFGPDVHRAFRKVMNLIRAATDERDLRALKSLRVEKMREVARAGQHSMRLNKQFRLIVRFETDAVGRRVAIVEIVDYH